MIIQRPLHARILLFDMDGTLVDATAAIERIWTTWADRHSVNVSELLAASRGQRVLETVRAFAPAGVDVDEEVLWLSRAAHSVSEGLVPIPGAVAFLRALPPSRWAIVTSAEHDVAVRWLTGAKIPLPSVLISGGDVKEGKPSPAGYLLAARALGHAIADAVVFEDSAAGVTAGHTAGAKVVGVANWSLAGNHRLEFWVPDFTALSVDIKSEYGLTIRLR